MSLWRPLKIRFRRHAWEDASPPTKHLKRNSASPSGKASQKKSPDTPHRLGPQADAPNVSHTDTGNSANAPCAPTSRPRLWGRVVPIAKRESSKRLVLGEVYVPYDPADPSTVDSQGHATTAQEIEQAAHSFLQASRQNQVDVQHNGYCGYGCVVESYLARAGDPSFTPGAWVVGIHVTDDATWQAIEKGDITGISLMGNAQLVPATEKDTPQPGVPQHGAAQPLEAT